MIFFINSSFSKQNSGIEHAQIKRAKLFCDNKEPFKLVFRDWGPRLHDYLNNSGIMDSEILSMFDYFQGTESVEIKLLHVEDIDFGFGDDNLTFQKEPENNRFLVTHGNQFVARVNYFADDEAERLKSIEQFDGFGNLYRVDKYDFRGFKTMSQFYTPDNKIGTEVWYNLAGQNVLEAFNRYDGKRNLIQSSWRLMDADGSIHIYSNIEELTLAFYNNINENYWDDEQANIFVMDRTHLADWHLKELDRPAYTVMHLHNSHAGDAQDPMHSVMNNFYEFGLTNANRYDAIISATKKQTRDVKRRFKPKSKLFTIPVGVVSNAQFDIKRVPMDKRTAGKVLVTARIAPEKRIDHIVEAIGIAKAQIPNISLDIYGYIDHRDNDQAIKAINQAIAKYHLEDSVSINNYAKNVGELQRTAQVYGLTSVMEGFNLSLMEAISNGMVGVTYDVNYGPNELILNNENGYVVPYDDINAMADRFVELFNNPELLQNMSTKSYELAERYSEKNVWRAWKRLLNDAKKKQISYVEDVTVGIGDQRK